MTAIPAHPALSNPSRKKKHWLRRIFLTILVLLMLAALTVQIVLKTDLPRGIVVGQLEKQLGLRLTVKTLSTGWLGNTELHDVTIGLPLADKAFLEVPVMRVKNTSLFGLMLGRPVEVESIELDRPHLRARQGADGTWNLQEIAQLLGRTGGQKTGEASAQTSATPTMPNVRIVDAILSIADNQNRTAEISPLSVNGYRDTGVSWKYDIQIPSRLSITGRLVPGGNWEHEVAVKVQNVGEWAKPWAADFPEIALDANWHGALSDTGVSGRLDVRNLSMTHQEMSAGLAGALTLDTAGDIISVRPNNLVVHSSGGAVSQVKLASGVISFNTATKDAKIDKLFVGLFGGTARVSADYNLNANMGRLDAAWENLSLPGNINHSGAFTATLVQPYPDQIKVTAHLDSTGTQPGSKWVAGIAFGLTGKSPADFDWNVHVDQLTWKRHNLGIKLDGLAMTGGLHDNRFALQSIGLPDCDLIAGSATYDLTGNKPWKVDLRGQRWPLPQTAGTELAFELHAHGDVNGVSIENSSFKTPDAAVGINAAYVFKDPKPLTLDLTIKNAPPKEVPVALAANTQAKLLHGTLEGQFKLTGTIDPLRLEAGGHLNGREIDVRGFHIGDVDLILSKRSRVDGDGVFVDINSLSLFGGRMGIDAGYQFDTDEVSIDIGFENISLAKLAAIAGVKDLTGTADGTLTASLPWFTPTPDHLRVPKTTITLRDVSVRGVAIDRITTAVSLSDGELKVEPVLSRGNGVGRFAITTHLDNLRRYETVTSVSHWPIDVPGGEAHVDLSIDPMHAIIELPDEKSPDPARRKLRIDAPQVAVHTIDTWKGERLCDTTLYAGIDGRVVDLRAFHVMGVLGGRADGQAHLDIDNPLASTAEFTCQHLDIDKLALLLPALNELHGKVTGELRLAPASVPHALEPLAVVIKLQFTDGVWRKAGSHPLAGVPIRDARVAAFFGQNSNPNDTGWRIVLDDSAEPNFIHVADGTIKLWGRFGIHGRANSSQGQITFSDLDLNKIVHAFDEHAAFMPGKVGGYVMFLRAPTPLTGMSDGAIVQMFPGRPGTPVRLAVASPADEPAFKQLLDPIYAEGHIDLTHANLANFGPFSVLYNAAHLFQNVKDAEGIGDVDFRIERGNFTEQMHYFNRGTEIRAVGHVDTLWKGKDSPVYATITVLARPLGSVKLPIFADIGQALTALQQGLGLAAVRVKGTIGNYHTSQLGLSELGADMRNFIVGDAKKK